MVGAISTIILLLLPLFIQVRKAFLNAVDTGANKKTASYCATLFLNSKTQAEEEFKCRTVGIVTDNEKKTESMRRKIIEFDNTLVTYGCSSHLLNLLGQDITPPNIMSQVKSKQILSKPSYTRCSTF